MEETYVTYFADGDMKVYMKYLFNLSKKNMVMGEGGRTPLIRRTGLHAFCRLSSMEEIQQEQFKLVIVL